MNISVKVQQTLESIPDHDLIMIKDLKSKIKIYVILNADSNKGPLV